MHDLETDFKKFYYNEVVLPKKETQNLRKKKILNIDRLKNGLNDYNLEKKTNYKLAENIEQGSVAMSTVTQNEENDYDIDISIVFDSTNLNGLGPIAVKNLVVDALKRRCSGFKTEPEAKTNCVRIVYSDNYHIDFAIYRRTKNSDGSYSYEHAGSEWRTRDPRAINNWFKDEITAHGEKLRQSVRLSKMFCKSRSSWKMPGGLIQSVLCDEKIQNYIRLDEMFYYTMKEVQKRLTNSIEINNPTDEEQSLLLVQEDRTKMNNLNTRLKEKLGKLDILFNDNCTEKEAIEAWYEFFQHNFWTYDEGFEKRASSINEMLNETNFIAKSQNGTCSICEDTEEFIENMMPRNETGKVSINCKIFKDGQYVGLLKDRLRRGEKVNIGEMLYFYVESINVYKPYRVFLKVKNVGKEAEIRNEIRGQIFDINSQELLDNKYYKDEAAFEGEHFVECYIEQNGVCVAYDFLLVPIVK